MHTATKMWVSGENPYDAEAYLPRFRIATGDTAATAASAPVLYPPSAYLLLAPWGLLDWDLARYVLVLVNVGALFVLIRTLPFLDPRGPPLSAVIVALLVLGWSPAHTSVAMGQVSLLIAALLAAATLAMTRKRFGWAALMIAVAACLKPQLGILFLVPLLAYGGWRPFLGCCAVGLVLLAVSGLRLTLLGIDWPTEWADAIAGFRREGEGDVGLGSPHRSLLIGLELVFAVLVSSKGWAALGSWVATLAALVWASVRDREARRRGTADPVWLVAVVCVATMLPGYHRFYDAVFVVIPAYWVVLHWPDLRSPGRWLALVGCALFFVLPNSQAVLRLVEAASPALLASGAWAVSLQIHQTWAFVGVLAGLLMLGPRGPAGRGREVAVEVPRRPET